MSRGNESTDHAADNGPFDIVQSYRKILDEDPELTMPIAAIESLIAALASTPSSTISETLELVSKHSAELKRSIPNSISLSAGTDIFQQYLMASLNQTRLKDTGFNEIRARLISGGEKLAERAKAERETIAGFGRHFIRDGDVILTNGGSRVVGSLLRNAAESSNSRGSIRFKVIYVLSSTSSTHEDESAANIKALRERDIPVATIPATAVAYCIDQVTQCFVGAEGVVENGGIVSRMGTYQMGVLAKAAGKPFYVVCERHKFVRLYPINQQDLGLEQNVVEFKTADGAEKDDGKVEADEGVADMDGMAKKAVCEPEETVDYTPPHLISGIITDSGVLLPSAVSEELIKIWF